jgi:hypothetical protein
MITRALVIATSVLVLTFSSLSAANAQLASTGLGSLSALGQARLSAATTAVLPFTGTTPQSDLGLFAVILGFAAVVGLFAVTRRYQAR